MGPLPSNVIMSDVLSLNDAMLTFHAFLGQDIWLTCRATVALLLAMFKDSLQAKFIDLFDQ